MSQVVYTHFLSRLTRLFGEPKTDDAEKFFAEYVRELKHYSATDLERGANALVRRQTFNGWPTVARCIEAVELMRPRSVDVPKHEEMPRPSREAVERTRKLIAEFKAEMQERAKIITRPARNPWQPPEVDTPADDPARRESLRDYIREREAQMYERDRSKIRARMAGEPEE